MRIQADLAIDDRVVTSIVQQFQQVVEQAFQKLKAELNQKPELPKPLPTPRPARVDLPESEQLKAADLRTAILLGKIPDDTGLLIDVKTTAKLLNVSDRTLYRLADMQAVPRPVKLGSLVRWQLAEIMEWLGDGCPSKWQRPRKKKGRL